MNAKKAIVLVAAAVLVYTLIAHPTWLGDGVQSILGAIGSGLDAVVTFLRSAAS